VRRTKCITIDVSLLAEAEEAAARMSWWPYALSSL
jgi:hypothetical protein